MSVPLHTVPTRVLVLISDPEAKALLSDAVLGVGWTLVGELEGCDLCCADFSAICWDLVCHPHNLTTSSTRRMVLIIPTSQVIEGKVSANAYYLKTGLVRKAELAAFASKSKAPLAMPLTVTGDLEDADDMDAFLDAWVDACEDTGERCN